MARSWYVYDGMGSPFLTTSYNLAFIKPICMNGCKVCAIYSMGTGPNPAVLSGNIRAYILSVMVSPIAQPSEPAGAKPYLYGKNC